MTVSAKGSPIAITSCVHCLTATMQEKSCGKALTPLLPADQSSASLQ